jgi:UTP-glucose-1-phosphate uridylyltransferase
MKLREGARQVRQMMEHRVAQDEVEAPTFKGQRFSVGPRGSHIQAQLLGVLGQHGHHA